MTKSICIICPYPQGVAAGQRLKYEQYLDNWRENGYSVKVFPFSNTKLWNVLYKKGNLRVKIFETFKGYLKRYILLFKVNRFDLVYVHQWTTPYGFSLYDFLLRKSSKKLIFDLEDFVILNKTSIKSTSKFVSFFRFNSRTNFMIKYSDHVITSSPTLNQYCKEINKKESATYISSSINTNRFVPSDSFESRQEITLGWTGTFSSIPYLDLIGDVLKELSKTHPFKLIVISNCAYKLSGVNCEVINWSKENEVKDLQKIDIGLYPLENSSWVMGKSGLKALQYMSFAIPTVATNVGTSKLIIKNNTNGFLVDSNDEWLKILKDLIENSDLRKRIGEEARKTILKNYSTDVIKHEYLNVIKNT